MEEDRAQRAVETVDTSLRFLLLFILGLLLSLAAVLRQRRQLCLSLAGGDVSGLPSPYPLQRAAGGITLGGLGFFFQLALETCRSARAGGDARTSCLAGWNLFAAALTLIAAAARLWALELGQERAGEGLAAEENAVLPA